MPVPSGTRLGPYEIVAPLGAGGMGEVYRARDPRLQREVAIKVLPAETAGDPEALARFDREARAVAALAHPNLLAIFDVGSEGGFAYAVTELLEGMTLRDRLAAGALPPEQAVALARQIALGLAAAHGTGIVHRDIKPENVFVTTDGHVKILDFGLAKRPAGSAAGATRTVAMTSATMPGLVMGTLGYMPPEQLLGLPVDARADLFAFGAVLYELLSGERAFSGASDATAMAAILSPDRPALSGFDWSAWPALEGIVRRCLEKDPEARFASAQEIVAALDQAEAAPHSAGAARAPGLGRRFPWRVAAIALVAVALGVLGARVWLGRQTKAGVPVRARAVAMLDFENLTGDHGLDWIGRGLPELLGTALARSSELDVYDPQRLANLLAGAGHPRDAAAPVFERLRDRGVGRAIVGSILRSGPQLRIECRVVEVESGRVLHADASQGPATADIFQLAGGLIPKLQTWLEIDLSGASAGDQWLREITTSSSDAYRLYLRGHTAMMASRWRESAGYDEQALALDSTFVAAWVDLAGCSWNLDDETRTKESLAAVRRLKGRASPREVLQLDMIDAVISGDPPRLIRTASSLHELYPENRFFTYLIGRGYYTAGRWDRCIATLEPLVRERWTWAWTYVLSGRAYDQLGRPDEARRSFTTGLEVTHRNPELVFVYARYLEAHGDSLAARDLILEASRSPDLAETPEFEASIRLELAKLYEAESRRDSAYVQYRRVETLKPADPDQVKADAAGLRRTMPGR